MIDDRLHVIEYSDLPDDVAERRDENGALVFWAGSIAVHVFDVELFARAQGFADKLPFHIARKKVEYLGPDGQRVKPAQSNALKFEKFIFDLLPHAQRPIVVEFAEEACFAPLKNAPGAPRDTPEYVRRMMCVEIEISPLFALDAQGVAERVKPGTRFDKSQYLAPE
jgi:UDP-N-acetylglucosamine/UDP-N-acetylgalactosamine diphosphorylase